MLELDGFGAVVFTSGFRPDYDGWARFPAFDAAGFPLTVDGASTVVRLYFCGVHFLRTRKSSLLWGVGEDAVVAQLVAQPTLPAGARQADLFTQCPRQDSNLRHTV